MGKRKLNAKRDKRKRPSLRPDDAMHELANDVSFLDSPGSQTLQRRMNTIVSPSETSYGKLKKKKTLELRALRNDVSALKKKQKRFTNRTLHKEANEMLKTAEKNVSKQLAVAATRKLSDTDLVNMLSMDSVSMPTNAAPGAEPNRKLNSIFAENISNATRAEEKITKATEHLESMLFKS